MVMQLPTDTGKWSLVVQRVSQTSAQIWVGTLFHHLAKPGFAYVELTDEDGNVQRKEIHRKDWQRPFRYMRQRFYTTVTFEYLQANSQYQVRFIRQPQACLVDLCPEQELRSAQFTTLPSALPADNHKPFVIGLGSCFYSHRDGGQAAGAYAALYDRGSEENKPDITFLTGDQVYLDIGMDSLSPIKSEIRERIADDYAKHWQLLGSIFNRGATWMLPDDHEYWNDFPNPKSPIPMLAALQIDYIRDTWTKASLDGVNRVQQSKPVEVIQIGEDLSICLTDTRTHRHKEDYFLPERYFNALETWAKSLTCPGVLVLSQPLIVKENRFEKNLLSYKRQYERLLCALAYSGHDIVLLSGDVHFGRVMSAPLGPNGGRLIEVISSPLSNLTGLGGFATATATLPEGEDEIRLFPHPDMIRIDGWPAQPVDINASAVSSKPGRLFSAYPRDRTKEHFTTVGFSKADSGNVNLKIKAWNVRYRDDNNLPVQDRQLSTVNFQLS